MILQQQALKDSKGAYEFYMAHISNVNNWDLVDVSAPHIIGDYLWHQEP